MFLKSLSPRSLTLSILLLLALMIFCTASADAQTKQFFDAARKKMVDEEIVAAGIKNPRVIESLRITPRHEFVSRAQRKYAYYDMALPTDEGQTISPPFVVAYMTESLDPQPTDKVLEIGTGSGYQAAVLSPLVKAVYSIEIVPSLGRSAARTLKRLRYDNVYTKIGDGFKGWSEHAPFDKIIVTCSPERVPTALASQLKEGGMIVIPVGERYQQTLYLVKKEGGKLKAKALRPTLFVPMTGQAEQGRKVQPDIENPQIVNGDFEEAIENDDEEKKPMAVGWHYQRQMELITDGTAPEGRTFAKFTNSQPSRGCQALQGFGLNGRTIKGLEFSCYVKGVDLRPGANIREMPRVLITFYDENRAMAGQQTLGNWRGTFDWQKEKEVIPVPARAREAIITVGLLGGVGEISFDGLRIEPVRR